MGKLCCLALEERAPVSGERQVLVESSPMLVMVINHAGQEGSSQLVIATVRWLKRGVIRTKLFDPALLMIM